MSLHDWSTNSGWEGVHQVWIVELLYWLKPRLPAGYRAYIGATPTFAIGAPLDERPDVGVRDWSPAENESTIPATASPAGEEPDQEIAVATLATDTALLIERHGQLIAAVELVSPRNKDRESARRAYTSSYVGYLRKGVHLLLVDVHRRPQHFSFADAIAAELEIEQPPCPAPLGISYRVGEPAPAGGHFLAIWRRPLTIGESLPTMQLALSVQESIPVDLDQTYGRATAAAYLT